MLHPLIQKLQTIGKLPDEDRQVLADLPYNVREFDPGEDIIREGDKTDNVHLMLEGWSCRYQIVEDGRRQITAFLVPGDFCDVHVTILGEMDHSIASLSPAKVAFISRNAMFQLTERPAIARALWWASLVDEATLRAWIVNMGRRNAFERISHMICEVHARLKNVGMVSDGQFELPLTQTELGDAQGLTAVHVNRVMKRLREEGLATLRKGHLTILDIGKLQQAAGFDPNYLHLAD